MAQERGHRESRAFPTFRPRSWVANRLPKGPLRGTTLRFGHAQEAEVGGAAGVVRADETETPLLIELGHRQLEVQVPREHGADVRYLARHGVGLLQKDRLLVLGDVAAVLVARRRG